MKPFRLFLVNAPDQNVLIAAVQKMCGEQFVQDALAKSKEWTFKIDQNKHTMWWDVDIEAEYEVMYEAGIVWDRFRTWLETELYDVRTGFPKTSVSVPEK